MQRLRVRFTKEDAVKFISHLDLAKAFTRALRRAAIPVAFSEGFNPHPRLYLASALRVGTTSEAEYLDVDLARAMPPEAFAAALAENLPAGIRIVEVREVTAGLPALMAMANLAVYRLEAQITASLTAAEAEAALAAFRASDQIMVERETSKGRRQVDIRPLTRRLALLALDEQSLRLEAALGMGPDGTGRPEEIIRVLRERYGLPLAEGSGAIHRTGLYHVDAAGTVVPLWAAR